MKNIFENAYFGKAYKTRNEEKAIFIRKEDNEFLIYANEQSYYPYSYKPDGRICITLENARKYDIISEWQPEISNEELDKI